MSPKKLPNYEFDNPTAKTLWKEKLLCFIFHLINFYQGSTRQLLSIHCLGTIRVWPQILPQGFLDATNTLHGFRLK